MEVHDKTVIRVNPEGANFCAATTAGNVDKDKNVRKKKASSNGIKSTTLNRDDEIKIAPPIVEFLAALIAVAGFLKNSFTWLMISMLLSLTGFPSILARGCLKQDKNLIRIGFNAGIVILDVGISVGMITGICIMWWKPEEVPWFALQKWPTDEMLSLVKCLKVEDLIGAITCGLVMALLILTDKALGTVFLQEMLGGLVEMPLIIATVNCGMFWGMSIFVSLNEMVRQQHLNFPCDQEVFSKEKYYWMGHNNRTVLYCTNTVKEFAAMGTVCLVRVMFFIILTFLIGNTFRLIKGFAECYLRKNALAKQDIKKIQKV